MEKFDPVAWGTGFVGAGLSLVGLVVPFIFKRLSTWVVVSVLGFGVISVGYGMYLLVPSWIASPKTQAQDASRSPPLPENRTKLPTMDDVFPIEKLLNLTFAAAPNQQFSYLVQNWGARSASDITSAVWMAQGRTFAKIASKEISYIAPGDFVSASPFSLPTASPVEVAICLSYKSNNRRVEAIHFFSNRERSDIHAPFNRSRDPVVEVDGTGLCSSMPRAAERHR
jgi:hypothetical protein